MNESNLFVDFENIQNLEISLVPDNVHIVVFLGCSQKGIPIELVKKTQALGERVEWLQIGGNGPNALDFHIAFYLGCCMTTSPRSQYFVLSKDTGFDPLLCYLKSKGLRCQRITNVAQLLPPPVVTPPVVTPPATPVSNYQRVLEVLSKGTRPARRASLEKHVAHVLPKTLSETQVKKIVNRLFSEGKVAETDERLTYTL